MKNLLLLCFIAVCSACHPVETNVAPHYFSVAEFFKNECSRLKEEKMVLLKKVRYDAREETMQIQQPVWEDELRPFLDCDINKPAYTGAYSIDSSATDGAHTIFYKAKEARMPIRLVTINYVEGKLSSVYIEMGKSNAWFELHQEMTYTPGDGYQINGRQKMAIGKETLFTIAGRFLSATNTSAK